MRFLYVEDSVIDPGRQWAEQLAQTMERDFVVVSADALDSPPNVGGTAKQIVRTSEERIPEGGGSIDNLEADIVFFATACNARRVQRFLDIARPFRMPYIFLTPVMQFSALQHILAPVTMLEEEVHKAELLSHLARYTHASITLLTAKDYGSRARTNTNKILTFLHAREQALGTTFTIGEQTAQSNSMSLYKELMGFDASLLVQTASRDYGLDDILFGPVERKIILHAHAPVALINPRADLFSLCD